MDETQHVKKVVDALKREGRSEGELHRKVFARGAGMTALIPGERFQVKRIVAKPGASLSLQMHHHRAEHWLWSVAQRR
jgi:mannose-1-phosphate guanylyltransferase/mannose-6-phosphate isomerase